LTATSRAFGQIRSFASTATWSSVFALALGLAIQFQVTLPITAIGLRANLADPLVCALILYLILLAWRTDRREIQNAVPPWTIWLLLLSLALTLALIVGIVRSGHVSHWALGSKYFGWFVLLGYFAVGLWIGTEQRPNKSRLFAAAFLFLLAAVGGVEALFNFLGDLGFAIQSLADHREVAGFMDNRNAFACVVLVGHAFVYANWRETGWRRWRTPLLLLLWLSLWYTGSRTGVAVGAAILMIAVYMRLVRLAELRPVATLALVVAFFDVAPHFLLPLLQSHFHAATLGFPPNIHPQPSPLINGSGARDLDSRIQGYRLALDLWLAHPILGSGLGSYIAAYQTKYGHPEVIHSTALWILTEMGIVGFVVFAGFLRRLIRLLLAPVSGEAQRWRNAALLSCWALLGMSLTNEVMYQRIIWLILGLGAAWLRQHECSPADSALSGCAQTDGPIIT
jgi:O-antigen ligase